MPGQCFSSIHTSVLSAGTAKVYHQAFKISFNIIFYRNINSYIHCLKNPAFLFAVPKNPLPVYPGLINIYIQSNLPGFNIPRISKTNPPPFFVSSFG